MVRSLLLLGLVVFAAPLGTEQLRGQAGAPAAQSSFVAGTIVLTEDGPRPIERIRVGDLVKSRNERTALDHARKVTKVSVRAADSVYDVRFVTPELRRETIRATGEHKFWTMSGRWVSASRLERAAQVLDMRALPLEVESVSRVESAATVYDLEVEEDHTYFVGTLNAWVHDAS